MQIKDLQTPIEVSTYDEVKAIMESGKYHIKSKYYQIFYSTEEIISLDCKSCYGRNQTYTISDLKDLESKLVLIRDHTSNDEVSNELLPDVQNADIEDFLNVRNH